MIDISIITTIMFDLDGTLLYSTPDGNKIFREYVKKMGFNVTKENENDSIVWTHTYWAESHESVSDFKVFGHTTEEFWENYSKRHLVALGLSEKEAIQFAPKIRKYMGGQRKMFQRFVPDSVYTMLKTLRENGYKLGLVTNRHDPIKELIDEYNFRDKFDFFLYAGEVKSWKPDQKIFLEALSRANAEASETIFIGDNYFADVVGAQKAGMTPIFIDGEGWMKNPDCLVIEDIGKITEIFSQSIVV